MVGEGDAKKKSKWRVVKLAIVPVIALVIVVLLGKALRIATESARRASCKNHLKQIGLALHIYATDHDESFPPGETAAEVLGKLIEGGYLEDGPMSKYDRYPVYVCPGAKQEVKAWKRTGKLTEETCSYKWVAGPTADSDPTSIVAFGKSPDNHWTRLLGITLSGRKGRNVLFVDGHVEWVGGEGFQDRPDRVTEGDDVEDEGG